MKWSKRNTQYNNKWNSTGQINSGVFSVFFDVIYSCFRTELSSLRQKLQQQYNEMNQAALNKTIDLKDKAFKEAEQEWEKDKNRLLQKVLGGNTIGSIFIATYHRSNNLKKRLVTYTILLKLH